jgi:hypothetical protein
MSKRTIKRRNPTRIGTIKKRGGGNEYIILFLLLIGSIFITKIQADFTNSIPQLFQQNEEFNPILQDVSHFDFNDDNEEVQIHEPGNIVRIGRSNTPVQMAIFAGMLAFSVSITANQLSREFENLVNKIKQNADVLQQIIGLYSKEGGPKAIIVDDKVGGKIIISFKDLTKSKDMSQQPLEDGDFLVTLNYDTTEELNKMMSKFRIKRKDRLYLPQNIGNIVEFVIGLIITK